MNKNKITVAIMKAGALKGALSKETITPELDTYYKIIDCDTIDIVSRDIDGRTFDFIVDDCGLLTDHPIASALNRKCSDGLFGNLIICHHDGEGYETGITEDDYKLLQSHVASVFSPDFKVTQVLVLD